VTAELDAAAEKIRDLSGDVADCLAGGMPHDTLTYRGSLLHELCQAALTMCKGYRAKPVAAPAAVCEGKPVSCFQCGSSSVKSDFDPDVGKWFECLNCEQKWSEKQMVLTDNDIPSRAPVCEWKKLPDAIGVWFGRNESHAIHVANCGVRGLCYCRLWNDGAGGYSPVDQLPRIGWLKADALPAPAGELERLRAELAEAQKDLDDLRGILNKRQESTWKPDDDCCEMSVSEMISHIYKNRPPSPALSQRLAEAEEDLEVTRQLEGSFWEALKPLNLPAINVQNPGAHVTDLIQRATAAEAEVAKYKPKVIVGDNITRLPKGCYAYQKQDWAAWGVKLVDRDDEIADRGWNFIRLPDAAPPSPQRGPASVEQSEESQ
jgi:hypothetical protein